MSNALFVVTAVTQLVNKRSLWRIPAVPEVSTDDKVTRRLWESLQSAHCVFLPCGDMGEACFTTILFRSPAWALYRAS